MKQSELNKLLAVALRESAKTHKWKCSRGFVFKATEMLFFSILINGQVKQRHLSYSLRYKMLQFDDLFWKIVKLEQNSKEPLSFRACGAWTTPTTEVFGGYSSIDEWHTDKILLAVNDIVSRSESEAEKVANEIQTLDDNLHVLERQDTFRGKKYPGTVINIWLQRLLTSILKQDYHESERIIQDRIENHDGGGFGIGNKSFYELADDYLKKVR